MEHCPRNNLKICHQKMTVMFNSIQKHFFTIDIRKNEKML